MSVKSVLGKIGKVALKVAPYAAMAIPGVGVPLGMAIAGASNAASKKLEGGSWKDSLISGGIGAGTAAIGGGALKGIGPSSGIVKKLGAGAAGKVTGTGVTGKIGGVLGNMASSALGKQGPLIDTNDFGSGKGIKSVIGNSVDAIGRMASNPSNAYQPQQQSQNQSVATSGNIAVPRQSAMMPNLGDAINAGRLAAAGDQGFRRGYDITAPNATDPTLPREVISRMPRINTDYASMNAPIPQRNQRKKSVLGAGAY